MQHTSLSDCPWHWALENANWPENSKCPRTNSSMLVHALHAAMQGAPEWDNDDNSKKEAIKRYKRLKTNRCNISVPEKEDMRTATGGKKSPQTVMQRVAPVRPGAQRAPVIINPVPRTKTHHQPSLPVSPPVSRIPNPGSGRQWHKQAAPRPAFPLPVSHPVPVHGGWADHQPSLPVCPPVSRIPNPGSGWQWHKQAAPRPAFPLPVSHPVPVHGGWADHQPSLPVCPPVSRIPSPGSGWQWHKQAAPRPVFPPPVSRPVHRPTASHSVPVWWAPRVPRGPG